MKTKIIAFSLIMAVSMICFIGCGPKGPKRVQISGTVTFDGEPVEQGMIKFESVGDGEVSDGGTIENGQFTIEVTTGQKKVHVKGTKVIGQYERDPQMNPGVMVDQLEDLPIPWNLTKDVTVEKKGQTFEIAFTTEEINAK